MKNGTQKKNVTHECDTCVYSLDLLAVSSTQLGVAKHLDNRKA